MRHTIESEAVWLVAVEMFLCPHASWLLISTRTSYFKTGTGTFVQMNKLKVSCWNHHKQTRFLLWETLKHDILSHHRNCCCLKFYLSVTEICPLFSYTSFKPNSKSRTTTVLNKEYMFFSSGKRNQPGAYHADRPQQSSNVPSPIVTQ